MDFSKFMTCPHGEGEEGLSQFADKGGQFFSILCRRLLSTAPYFEIALIDNKAKKGAKAIIKTFQENLDNTVSVINVDKMHLNCVFE